MAGLWFGPFAEITTLNRRFVPGRTRLKLTIDLNLEERAPGATPALFMASLQRLLPNLTRHNCCGHGRIEETFFTGDRRPACAPDDVDDAVDIAHLLEHLIIDFQHGIADMRVCSGITCGHRTPITRYDLFVETPDERIGRVCVALACDLMNRLLRGAEPDPASAMTLKLARHIYRASGASFTPEQTAGALGDRDSARDALLTLLKHGFVRENTMAINFSRVPLYVFNAIEQVRS